MFWEIAIFFVVSIVLSMVGMGGGIFYVPLLLFLGYDFGEAAAISLFLITITGFSAFLRYRKANVVDWQLALVLETFTDIGAFTGGATALHYNPVFLKILLGVLLLIAARFTIKSSGKVRSAETLHKGFGYWHRRFGTYSYSLNLFLVIPLTFVIGYLSGLLGIAGGVFKIPVMILWFGIPLKIAVATSALMVSLTGLLGLSGHLLHTSIDWTFALVLGVTVFAGGQIGSRISLKLPEKKVKRALALILVVIGLYMIIHTALQ